MTEGQEIMLTRERARPDTHVSGDMTGRLVEDFATGERKLV